MSSIYLSENKLNEAMDAAMALVSSTPEQTWVSIGRQLLERIEGKLSVKVGAIGCLLPLSGPFSIYGQEALNGIQLGMGIFDKPEGEQSLELIIKDTKGKTEETVLAVEELVRKEKVMALIGPLASKPALAAAIKAQELGIPIITLTQKEGITAEGKMVFRNFLTPSKEIQRLLDKAMNEMGLKKFAILYPDNPYGQFFMNLFWDNVEERGGMITAVESYMPDETDFAVEIKKMVGLYYPRPESVVQMLKKMKKLEYKNEKEEETNPEEELEPIVDFDAVFIPDNHQQAALVAPQFPFNNIFNVRFLGTSLWQSSELLEIAYNYVQGAVFPSGFFAESQSGRVIEFVELYRGNFESEPGILAASGYDTIRILKNIIDNSEIRTKKDFQKKLSLSDKFYGVTGKISFDAQGEVEKDPILLTISGKRLQVLP
jgi:ABC-type branched-subunit amino acid transport system substrate-binding protein